jgi:hypothetical protein
MGGYRCACGFQASDDLDLKDHFLEVFAPKDGIAADGTVHEEGRANLTCSCGFTASTVTELDDHFLSVFRPEDYVGSDGARHVLSVSGSALDAGQAS